MRGAQLVLAGLVVACGAHHLLGVGAGVAGWTVTGWLGTLALALAAGIAFARGVQTPATRTASWGIAGGLAFWALSYPVYYFGWQPWAGAPAISDLGWLLGYLGFYVAILAHGKSRVAHSRGVWLDGLSGSLALAAAAVAAIVPVVRESVDGSLGSVFVALAYPLADALLLCFLVALAAMTGWRPGAAFGALAAAMVLLVVGDLPYFLDVAAGDYVPGGLPDVGWLAAAAAMALATSQPPDEPVPATSRAGLAVAFPIACGLLAVGVLVHGATGEVGVPAVMLGALACAAALTRIVLSHRELHDLVESRRLARTDDLTGLANRRHLLAELEALLSAGPAAVVLFDLDRFKELNDTLGHEAGDAVLCAVAERLSTGLGDRDLAARLGGDEFAVLLPDGDRDRALAVAERLAAAIGEPTVVDGVTLRIVVSAGIVLAPEDGTEAEQLLRRAGLALSGAKGRPGEVTAYTASLDDRALERLRLAADLERALDEDELVLHFQPIADARSGEIASVEGLVRWEHPDRGLLGPGTFLPALERTSLTHRFSRMVLEQAIRQSVAFRDAGRPLRVAVNLMPADVIDEGLAAEVARLLVLHGADPGSLMLEVTETGVLPDFDRASDVLSDVRELGVHVALDDFGTGHSSLTHLQRLPVDVLKVDRSFVTDTQPATAAIVRSMIELAHTLGQRVVAEGIEDAELWRRLAGWGCDFAQGWVIGRAVPAAQLLETFGELEERARDAAGRAKLHVVA